MKTPLEAMQRDLREVLACFVDQEIDGSLIVSCGDMAGGLVGVAVDEFDQRHEGNHGLSFGAPVDAVDDYVATFAAAIRQALREADEAAKIAEERPDEQADTLAFLDSLGLNDITDPADKPSGPDGADEIVSPEQIEAARVEAERFEAERFAEAEDPTRTPGARLLAVVRVLLARIDEDERRLLLALIPARISDHDGYQRLLAELLRAPLPGLRLVVRDTNPAAHVPAALVTALAKDPSLHLFEFPVDSTTLVDSTRVSACDPSRSVVERLSARLQIGFYELGHGSLDDADRHFCTILAELTAGGDEAPQIAATMLPLALSGRGEVMSELGDTDRAIEHLLAAWQTGTESPPTLKATIALSLGRCLLKKEQLRAAQGFLALASGNAERCGAKDMTATALTELGDVTASLGDVDAARDAWECARARIRPTATAELAALDRRLQQTQGR